MTGAVKLSISALAATRRIVDHASGAAFTVEPLSAEENIEAKRKCTDLLGHLNEVAYGIEVLVTRKKLKDWEGVGDKGAIVPCNAENATLLLKNQGERLTRILVGECISIDNYVVAEVAEAKKG